MGNSSSAPQAAPAPIAPHAARAHFTGTAEHPGIDVHLGEGQAPVVTDAWTMGGWVLRFARLDAGQTLPLGPAEGERWVKVVTGSLASPARGAYPPAGSVRTVRVDGDEVTAGPDGAVLALITKTAAVPDVVRSVDELAISGPLADALGWFSFSERLGHLLSAYAGADAHGTPGWHLLGADGEELAYVWVWIAGKGTDMVTHDHGNAPGPGRPAFAEVHLVLHNGTGQGGMYETPAPGSPERVRTPTQAGEEHGPFFRVDAATGTPRRRDNGAVDYPWHSWEAGPDDGAGPAYDVIVPFEIVAEHARVSA
jgi:hypothetical protein